MFDILNSFTSLYDDSSYNHKNSRKRGMSKTKQNKKYLLYKQMYNVICLLFSIVCLLVVQMENVMKFYYCHRMALKECLTRIKDGRIDRRLC